jgi:hypothetical protein
MSTEFYFERSSKRRKGFPSETRVKRSFRVVHCDKELSRSSGGKTHARAVLDADFKNCCMRTGLYDGSLRNHYQR